MSVLARTYAEPDPGDNYPEHVDGHHCDRASGPPPDCGQKDSDLVTNHPDPVLGGPDGGEFCPDRKG